MNRDDIERMARKVWSAGDVYIGPSIHSMERFAVLVAAAEREACAKVCDAEVIELGQRQMEREALVAGICAASIRARGEK